MKCCQEFSIPSMAPAWTFGGSDGGTADCQSAFSYKQPLKMPIMRFKAKLKFIHDLLNTFTGMEDRLSLGFFEMKPEQH